MNGIRQICDDAKNYPGLLWLFTGTPTFFDDRRGVKGLEALNDRIAFDAGGGLPSPRQPQLELKPFDNDRLMKVALKLRSQHPDIDAEALEAAVPDGVVQKLVENVSRGFKGDVGVVPRHFLRQYVNMLDQVVEYGDEYKAAERVGFVAADTLSPEEARAMRGEPAEEPFAGDTLDI